jgi:hypothetical protein
MTGARGKTRFKSAEEIYKQQNQALHKAMSKLAGRPYQANKEEWLGIFSELLGRRVKSLSVLTLGERDQVIKMFQSRYGRQVLFNPAVPKSLREWQKGDQSAGYEQRMETDKRLRLIYSLWVEGGQEPKSLPTMIRKRYHVDDPRFMSEKQKTACINYLLARLKESRRGPAHYYE